MAVSNRTPSGFVSVSLQNDATGISYAMVMPEDVFEQVGRGKKHSYY